MGTELPTLGPFARLQTSSGLEVTSASSLKASNETPDEPPLRASPKVDSHVAGQPAIAANRLNFTYPGIGERYHDCQA